MALSACVFVASRSGRAALRLDGPDIAWSRAGLADRACAVSRLASGRTAACAGGAVILARGVHGGARDRQTAAELAALAFGRHILSLRPAQSDGSEQRSHAPTGDPFEHGAPRGAIAQCSRNIIKLARVHRCTSMLDTDRGRCRSGRVMGDPSIPSIILHSVISYEYKKS